MKATPYHGEIQTIAAQFGLAPDLVEAVVWCESAGRTDAFRFEPGVWARIKDDPRFDGAVPREIASSYGLMQVLYTTALMNGFPKSDPPQFLFIPQIGLTYGCKELARLLAWSHNNRHQALAAFNGGPGGYMVPAAQQYATKVLNVLNGAAG